MQLDHVPLKSDMSQKRLEPYHVHLSDFVVSRWQWQRGKSLTFNEGLGLSVKLLAFPWRFGHVNEGFGLSTELFDLLRIESSFSVFQTLGVAIAWNQINLKEELIWL